MKLGWILFACQTMRSSYPTISVDLDLGRDSGQTAGAVKVNIFMTATDCVYLVSYRRVNNSKNQKPRPENRKPTKTA